MNESRRLAAFLAAEVVGCSRLMGEDEPGAAKRRRRRTAHVLGQSSFWIGRLEPVSLIRRRGRHDRQAGLALGRRP